MNNFQVKGILKRTAKNGDGVSSALSDTLREIRNSGICTTRCEVDAGLVGYAVPMGNKPRGIAASLSCIFSETDLSPELEPGIAALLFQVAGQIEQQIQQDSDQFSAGSPEASNLEET